MVLHRHESPQHGDASTQTSCEVLRVAFTLEDVDDVIDEGARLDSGIAEPHLETLVSKGDRHIDDGGCVTRCSSLSR
jgi:hypothetical protein